MDNNSKTFVLQYFHGGKFLSSSSFSYVGSSIEKFQIDPDTTCLWDITGNVKELRYKDDVWVYYRVPGVPFNSDALVLIHDDNTMRQCMDFLNMMGIVDIYVDHMKNYKTLAKDNEVGEGSNEVGEGSNKTLIAGSSNVQFVGDETREETSADSKEVEREEAVVGEKEVSTDSKEVECEKVDCEEVVVGEKEAYADSEDFLVNNEVCSDLDEEVEEIRGKLRAGRKIISTESSTDEESSEDNNEDAVEGQTFVGDDTLEGEDVREIEDHESDYIPSDDPGEYGETDEESDDDICGAYRGKGKKSIGVNRDNNHKAVFHRMYICFAALRKGWKEGCRPFIGVDGCFLKHVTRGHPNGEGLTLMSDQQKGLVPVINEFFPLLKHRMCARHIYANWHKKWKWMNRKIQFWNCVRSTFVEDFDDQLKILEGMRLTSTNGLLGIPPQHWSRAYFIGESKCDVVDNNLSEAFNGWIVDARCYPIINMLEEIRKMKFERNMDVSNQCKLVWNGDGGFESVREKIFWPKMNDDPIGPPQFIVMPGRPKKKRRKNKDEPLKPKYDKASKTGYKVRCSKCKQVGHKKNNCLQNDNVDNTGQSASNVQNSQSSTNVQSSTTIDVGSTCKRKRQVGVGLYTNLKTGEQIYNLGLPTEMVVTTNKKKKIGAPTSQYQHTWKGPGLQWKGKRAITTRQLQQQLSDERS
ncbi:hypothetical protein V6N11_070716 [Hibiscus sabdariffa]|uniref:PB1-like domain-containing protein n=1 Tax=Hibiscus sabdariffa TaxID=183260 RepID=A0ABR2QG88_9ROSI